MNSSTSEPVVAIVVMTGPGSRLGASMPKVLVEFGGMSPVHRSALAMHDGDVGHVAVITPGGCLSIFEVALSGLDGITRIVGGTEHQDSVRLGLDVLSERFGPETVVLIHDAARPLMSPQAVTTVLHAVAHDAEAAIPMVAVRDSIRQIGDDGPRVIDRSTLRAIQAPQGIQLGLFREAHKHVARHGLAITDGASTIEALGYRVVFVPEHHNALKVVKRLDLALAQGILGGRSRI